MTDSLEGTERDAYGKQKGEPSPRNAINPANLLLAANMQLRSHVSQQKRAELVN